MENATPAKENAKKNGKRKNQLPVAFAYFLTLLICLVAFGFLGYYVLDRFVFKEDGSSMKPVDLSVPTAEDRFSTLYIQVDDFNEMKSALLVRIIPDKCQVRIVPVSPGLMSAAYAEDAKTTVGEIYAQSGVTGVKKAVENAYGVPVDKYMTVTNSSFDSVVDYIGGITYTPTEDMFYFDEKNGDEISCRKGEKIALNHNLLRVYINYPKFSGGQSQNVKIMSDVMTKFINEAFMQVDMLSNNMDTIFNVIYNSSDTDMTRNEYIRYKKGILYILENETSPCESITPVGTWTGDKFEPGESFSDELKKFFGI